MTVDVAPEQAFATRMQVFERRNLILIVLDGSLFAFAVSLLSETTIVPAFVQALTGSATLVGLVGATFALGRYLPQLVGAHIVQGRPLRKPALLWIVIAERVGILAIAITAQLIGVVARPIVIVLFFVAFCGYAITTGLIGPVYGDFVAKALPRTRGWYYALSQLVGGLLGFTAALVAQQILSAMGFPQGNQVCFWLCFALSFLSIPLIASLRDLPFPGLAARGTLAATLGRIPALLRADRSYRRFLGVRCLQASSTAAVGFVVVAALARGLIDPAGAALLAAVYVLAQAGGGFLLSVAGNFFGWKTVVVLGGALVAAGMLGALLAGETIGLCAVFAALGAANAATIVGDPNMSI